MIPRAPFLGWLGAATTAAALLTGAAALAITALPPPPVMIDLGQLPPAAPAIAAIAEAAPQVVDEAPAQDMPAAPIEHTPPPAKVDAPAAAAPISLPKPQVLSRSDLAMPTQEPAPKPARPQKQAKPEKLPDPKPAKTRTKDKPQEPKEKPAEIKPAKQAAKPAASSAPHKGQKAKGGAAKVSPAAYAKAVMKKVRTTKKKSGAGKGLAVVGFTVDRNGGLAAVKLIRTSGNTALDQLAVSHIQRSAPFPAPPEGAGRSFSFEFVGK